MIPFTKPEYDDSLTRFLVDYLTNEPALPPVTGPVVHMYERVVGSTLYRSGRQQVQLFTIMPNTEIPMHAHPDVDSYEVYLGGDIHFRIEGGSKTVTEIGAMIRLFPDTQHGATIGQRGGLLLSVQEWRAGVDLSSIGESWTFHDPCHVHKSFEAGAH